VLARIARGEAFEVTDRGRLVARLVPVEPDPWADLLPLRRPSRAGSHGDLLEVRALDLGVDASAELGRLRDER
jgi:antitoxin (DNA-binding transcriptional repressor) of toxin-antitoxin stability system